MKNLLLLIPVSISRKLLIRLAAGVGACLLVALVLGDHRQGLGRHSAVVADFGNVFFVLFKIGVLILILGVVLALVHMPGSEQDEE